MKIKKILCTFIAAAMLTASAACSSSSQSSAPASGADTGTNSAAVKDGASAGTESAGDGSGEASAATGEGSGEKEITNAAEGDSKREVAYDPADSYSREEALIGPSIGKADAVEGSDSISYGDRSLSIDSAAKIKEGTAPAVLDSAAGSTAAGESPDSTKVIDGEMSDPIPGEIEYQPAQPGLLTAGEWKDNDNWGFFTNLVNAGTITFPSFGIDPRSRTAVTLKSNDGKAVANAQVRLLDADGKILWKAVTDHNGKAYLFAYDDADAAAIEAESGGKTIREEITKQQTSGQQSVSKSGGEYELTIDDAGTANKKTEIMFIVDSTGSMSDEMLFLQSEFAAIAKEVGTDNTSYSVNFYRDEYDDYVTKCDGFTSDLQHVQMLLNNETADGGGDTPEAVDAILKETLSEGKWSDDSVKLAFLIFDAPPHEGKEETLRKAIEDAAAKGIRLIPVVSSNSERETELFARSIAISTGGTYIFLTDDSGIGGSHLEPIIGDYEVEKLYDIIIRVINEYKQ